MAGYEIGISGLHAAQRALDVIGNNIANAATEGYHRQDIDLRPADDAITGGYLVGQGVNYNGIIRRVNQLIEEQILQQESFMSSLSRQAESLRSIESALAELTSGGISTALDNFYNSFQELSVHPDDINLQSAVASAAQTLSNQLRNAAAVVTRLEDAAYSESQTSVQQINELSTRIAQMNRVIYEQQVRGFNAGNVMDQRDQLVAQMNQLAGVTITSGSYGQVNVSISNIPVVVGNNAVIIDASLVDNEGEYDLVLNVAGSEQYDSEITGGSLGGLIDLRNETLRGIRDKLDTLAGTIISQINQIHVQGVGSDGSFTTLTGWLMTNDSFSDYIATLEAGVNYSLYVRVTAPDGSVARHEVTINSNSTMQSIAEDIADITGLSNTSINSGRLQITADTGYAFDFLPGAMSEPSYAAPLVGGGTTATAAPSISIGGLYTGAVDQEYTCTVTTEGGVQAIGTGVMTLEIVNSGGAVVASVNIGQGYSAGTPIILENGLTITLGSNGVSPGYFDDDDEFTISALANSDTSGFLTAAGLNCFFAGNDASSISLSGDITASCRRIAVSRGFEQSDNTNALAIARLANTALEALDGASTSEYYRDLATDVGNKITFTQTQYDNAEAIQRSLTQQRDQISGVDINDQAMKMMIFERMFQAMSKYISTIDDSLKTLMGIIS
jgi:flagellar hook-associated protein 1 FlgK